jgi:hypothetical protein
VIVNVPIEAPNRAIVPAGTYGTSWPYWEWKSTSGVRPLRIANASGIDAAMFATTACAAFASEPSA